MVISAQYTTIYHQHAFGTCTLGTLYDNTPPIDQMDSIVWSTGHVGFALTAAPGVYSYTGYSNGVSYGPDTTEILQLNWDWYTTQFWANVGRPIFNLHAEVPYYGTQIYQSPCCGPQQFDCVAELYQDGIMIESYDNWFIPPGLPGGSSVGMVAFTNTVGGGPTGYPAGHQYHIKFIDNGCGHVLYSDTTTAFSCSNMSLDLQVVPSLTNASNGIIELIKAVPDTTEAFPIYSPVFSSTILLSKIYPSPINISLVNSNVDSYTWSGLDTGYYEICFIPEQNCSMVCDTVFVPNSPTSIIEQNDASHIYYSSADQHLYSSVPVKQLKIWDANGKQVRLPMATGAAIDLSSLLDGLYLYEVFSQSGEITRGRFVVQ